MLEKISSNYKNYGGFAINGFTLTMQAESSYSQSAVISVKAERMLLTDLFSQIEKQSEFLFFYVDKDVANIKVT